MMQSCNIDTEKAFGEVVRAIGGRCLDDEFRGRADFKNADFAFDEHNCIGELKRVRKFLDEDPAFMNKLGKLYERWVREKRLPNPPSNVRFVTFDLPSIPRDCAEEVMRLFRTQLMGAYLEKANRQIRETKQHLMMPDAFGIVFLAVEGTSWYAPHGLLSVLARIPKGRLDAVDAFVVFNSNYMAKHEALEEEVSYWLCARYSERPKPSALTDGLAVEWGRKIATMHSGPMTSYYPHPSEIDRIVFPGTG